MAGKARVHELAKELGVTSKEILAWLNEAGEFVKSASSTLERPVARRLREAYAAAGPRPKKSSATRELAAPAAARAASPARAGGRAPRREHLTTRQLESIAERYQLAAAATDSSQAIHQLYLESAATYRIPLATLRQIVAADRRRNPARYARLPSRRNGSANHSQTTAPHKPREAFFPAPTLDVDTRGAARRSPGHEPTTVSRPRVRTAGLPAAVAVANPDMAAKIILSHNPSSDAAAIVKCLQDLTPTPTNDYGYLTWRYTAMHRAAHAEVGSTTTRQDLATLAQVIDHEKPLLDTLIHVHGPILDRPGLATRAMDNELRDLTDGDDIGRSAADELRRVRGNFQFLRRGLLLAIASPDNHRRLWDAIGQIQPPTPDRFVETIPQLESATARLNDLLVAIDRLLITDDASLQRFFCKSHSELVALQADCYDFVRPFRDTEGFAPTSQTTTDVAFPILPQGPQIRTLLDGIRHAGLYRGHQVDERRVDVLQDLQTHFGADRCTLYTGSPSSSGVNDRYLVLTIKPANGSREHAVAISPLAGIDATYVVCSDCVEADWRTVLATPKSEARQRGAQRLLFTQTNLSVDQYSAMRDKVINVLGCQAH